MKYVIYSWLCGVMLLVPSCGAPEKETVAENNATNELVDLLQTANAEKDSLLRLFNEISSGLDQLKDMEHIVTVDLNKETPDRKEQLRTDMRIIQEATLDSRLKLEALEAKLSKSVNFNAEMERTIKSLRMQLETQESKIAELQTALRKANLEIGDLNLRVDSLRKENSEINREKIAAQDESVKLANQLNTCYYVVGSKSELKKYNIIETSFLRKTKIMEGDFEKSYFTKADKRTLSSVNLHSKKVEVLSKHPKGSYKIVENNGAKVLEIINPADFWELSNYLIVQID